MKKYNVFMFDAKSKTQMGGVKRYDNIKDFDKYKNKILKQDGKVMFLVINMEEERNGKKRSKERTYT